MDVSLWILVLIVLIPFAGTGFILLFHNRPDAREAVSLAAALLTSLLCVLSLPSAFASGTPGDCSAPDPSRA